MVGTIVMTDLEVVQEMLSILDTPEHWCQGRLYDYEREAYCLMGALNKACFNDWRWHYSTQSEHIRYILNDLSRGKDLGDYYDSEDPEYLAVEFNNAPSTTFEDVKLMLEEALTRV